MRAIGNQKGLYRTACHYYFRRSIPAFARDTLRKRECKCSFRHADYKAAKRKSAWLNNALDEIFAIIERMEPDNEEIKRIIRNFFEKCLIDAEGFQWEDNEAWREEADVERVEQHDGKTPDERIEELEDDLEALRELAKGSAYLERYRELAEELLAWRGYDYYEMAPGSQRLRKGLMDADIEARRIELAARKGETQETEIRHPLFRECRNFITDPDIDLLIQNEGLPYYEREPRDDVHQLGPVVERYIQHLREEEQENDKDAKTVNTIVYVISFLTSYFDERKPLYAISKDDCRRLRDIIKQFPAYYKQRHEKHGRSIMDVIDNVSDYEKLDRTTIHKYWGYIKSFFRWAKAEGYMDHDPTEELAVNTAKNTKQSRDSYTNEQLQTLFSSPQYTGHKSYNKRYEAGNELIRDIEFWSPLIALYTGMRRTEIAELSPDNIQYKNGIYYFDLHEGIRLKTEQSARVIPMHPELVKIGIPDYMQSLKDKYGPDAQLIDDFRSNATDRLNKFSGKFGTYLEKIGIKHSKLVFHSFRHNFKDALMRARIDPERRRELMGHEEKAGSAHEQYGSYLDVEDLYDDICAISYDLDLSHLYTQSE